jgi:hypothetical protein
MGVMIEKEGRKREQQRPKRGEKRKDNLAGNT